jgi:hypothetical protein
MESVLLSLMSRRSRRSQASGAQDSACSTAERRKRWILPRAAEAAGEAGLRPAGDGSGQGR